VSPHRIIGKGPSAIKRRSPWPPPSRSTQLACLVPDVMNAKAPAMFRDRTSDRREGTTPGQSFSECCNRGRVGGVSFRPLNLQCLGPAEDGGMQGDNGCSRCIGSHLNRSFWFGWLGRGAVLPTRRRVRFFQFSLAEKHHCLLKDTLTLTSSANLLILLESRGTSERTSPNTFESVDPDASVDLLAMAR
jgi:hypothetical protein